MLSSGVDGALSDDLIATFSNESESLPRLHVNSTKMKLYFSLFNQNVKIEYCQGNVWFVIYFKIHAIEIPCKKNHS